ncbi:MAG TPA: AraC family transcriptional regulator [Agriterribacter sp.]|nr:AraC family transcriptional regulator [Agriterribacter sp.]
MRKKLQQYYLKKAGLIANGSQPLQPGMGSERIREKPEDAFIIKLGAIVEQHLSNADFTVEQLCRLVFMSHSQLHRKLDALTGYSPNRFVRLLRLKKAKALLQNPANSIASVALDCGYNDPGYFARVFKQENGTTPQEWRAANS